MGDFNMVVLKGRVGKDAEFRSTSSGTGVANFSLATSTGKKADGQKKTDWHRIVCWGKVAQVAEEYVKKGAELLIQGEISYGEYEKDGVKIHTTDVVARSIVFCGSRQTQQEGSPSSQGSSTTPDEDNDNDVPF